MTATEIRQHDPIAARSWESREGIGEQIYQLAMQVQEIAAQLAEMNLNLGRLANVNPDDTQECREKKCTYFQHYLAYGPADLTHEGYHAVEAQATAHFKNCTYGEDRLGWVCPTCSRFEQRIRA